MDDVAVLLEHVDLLNSLDRLDVHLLESGLELLVVGGGGLVNALGLAAGSTLSSNMVLVFAVSHVAIDFLMYQMDRLRKTTDGDQTMYIGTVSLHTLYKKK